MTGTPGSHNTAPTAADDSYATPQDTPLSIAAPGVLGNDTDADGDALAAAVTTGASNGSVALGADGVVHLHPNAGFAGTDSFTYTASDGNGGSDTATVTVVKVEADVSVGITDSPDPVKTGGTVTYTVTVANAGPSPAADVKLSPRLTGGSLGALTPSQGTCTTSGGKTKTVTCSLGNIASGSSATVKITATAPKKTGTMSLSATTPDPNSANNTRTESTTIVR